MFIKLLCAISVFSILQPVSYAVESYNSNVFAMGDMENGGQQIGQSYDNDMYPQYNLAAPASIQPYYNTSQPVPPESSNAKQTGSTLNINAQPFVPKITSTNVVAENDNVVSSRWTTPELMYVDGKIKWITFDKKSTYPEYTKVDPRTYIGYYLYKHNTFMPRDLKEFVMEYLTNIKYKKENLNEYINDCVYSHFIPEDLRKHLMEYPKPDYKEVTLQDYLKNYKYKHIGYSLKDLDGYLMEYPKNEEECEKFIDFFDKKTGKTVFGLQDLRFIWSAISNQDKIFNDFKSEVENLKSFVNLLNDCCDDTTNEKEELKKQMVGELFEVLDDSKSYIEKLADENEPSSLRGSMLRGSMAELMLQFDEIKELGDHCNFYSKVK